MRRRGTFLYNFIRHVDAISLVVFLFWFLRIVVPAASSVLVAAPFVGFCFAGWTSLCEL